jgi:chemotaxis protein methyltransferase CheR
MREAHGVDISIYDASFLAKTVAQRMRVVGVDTIAAYGRILEESEADALAGALTITYSEFFRNPLAFALLESVVLPGMVHECARTHRSEIRVWSAGCAAGQEAYSVAILLDELLASQGDTLAVRIFATDRSFDEVASARRGVYDEAALGNTRLKHVRAHFAQQGNVYEVIPRLRDRIDFSVYDLLDGRGTCPPASIYGGFDLVFCSNLLFYYTPEVRESILGQVRGCLSDRGYLVTGEAEKGIVEQAGGLRAVAPPAAVYQRADRGR